MPGPAKGGRGLAILAVFLSLAAGLASLAGLELALRAQRAVRRSLAARKGPSPAPAAYRAAYRGREAEAAELHSAESAVGWGPSLHRPFIEWTRAPHSSRLVNIGPDGLRKTCFNDASPGAAKIWVFGGSTVWGTGAPDCETIPSHLAALLNAGGKKVSVANFGEGGFVSTQDLIRLELALRDGGRPDAVVFYGGLNDLWTALFIAPGSHQNYQSMRRRLESGPRGLIALALRSWALNDYLTLYYARRLLGRGAARAEESWVADGRADPEAVAREYLSRHMENLKIARAVARAYGASFHAYWQPSLFDKGLPTPEEGELIAQVPAALRGVFEAGRRQAPTAGRGAGLSDLSGAFARDPRAIFLDVFHLSGDGNKDIARAIARDLLK